MISSSRWFFASRWGVIFRAFGFRWPFSRGVR
jgi:hypothetical protein